MITFSVARPLRYAAIRHSVPAELIKGWAAAKVRPARSQLIGLIVAVLLLPCVACADAIDGHWCHDDGRRFEIVGPIIVTPARAQTQGRYDRHYFSYVVPLHEPGAALVAWPVVACGRGSGLSSVMRFLSLSIR